MVTNVNPNDPNHEQYPFSNWYIYDSLNEPSIYLPILLPQLKRLAPDRNQFSIYSITVNRQVGSDYCGLFALSYAISIFLCNFVSK